ncbi:LysR family transcriptional regulator [Corallococcus sp. H22C18031201]|uniref:LysR family transcriptional regulator n=1 Tax=Citreicoccus inhibens TaxID=2849499 RepID=UPI000E76C8DC|nr:LysR family transcriptional regulator [Citreicoccus inhibens]MBU8894111.1 LysR family transcriptional regulator [Citreicoccus inhibens]RJS23178.1 LysR family transcriptional regulator [Corallococcus sp. H22C18031201]
MSVRLDPRRLETFRVVATTGQVSAASRLLHLSQPAVTAQVRQLERECGQPLLVRTARGVRVNEAGRVLLDYARRMHALLEEAALTLAPETEDLSGELALAASTTLANSVVPELLASFLGGHPGLTVRLEVGNTEQVLGWLTEGRVPLGLVEGHARAAGIRLERYLEDELVPVVSARAPTALQRVRDVQALGTVPLVWREPGSGTRAVLERALRRAGARRGARPGDLQLGSTEAIKGAVALGLGVGFLSRWSIQAELAQGRLRVLPIPGLHIPRALSWALPVDAPSGIAGRFLRHARLAPPLLLP